MSSRGRRPKTHRLCTVRDGWRESASSTPHPRKTPSSFCGCVSVRPQTVSLTPVMETAPPGEGLSSGASLQCTRLVSCFILKVRSRLLLALLLTSVTGVSLSVLILLSCCSPLPALKWSHWVLVATSLSSECLSPLPLPLPLPGFVWFFS